MRYPANVITLAVTFVIAAAFFLGAIVSIAYAMSTRRSPRKTTGQIVLVTKNGAGNQLFDTARMYAVAQALNVPLFIYEKPNGFEHGGPTELLSKFPRVRNLPKNRVAHMNNDITLATKPWPEHIETMIFESVPQHARFASNVSFLKTLKLPAAPSDIAKAASRHKNRISLHVRRGDYLEYAHGTVFSGVLHRSCANVSRGRYCVCIYQRHTMV